MARKTKTTDKNKEESKALKAEVKALKAEVKALKSELDNSKKMIFDVDGDNRLIINNYPLQLHPITVDALRMGKTKKTDFPEIVQQALNIGLLARKQGSLMKSIEHFNDKLSGDFAALTTHMELLENKLKSDNTYKKNLEIDVTTALIEYKMQKGYMDDIRNTGTEGGGRLGVRNMTGDALITIEIEENKKTNIGVEVKMATEYALGNISSKAVTKDKIRAAGKNNESAHEQILETNANNDACLTIFVCDGVTLDPYPDMLDIQYIPEIRGFMVKVDVMSADYSNLTITYEIARQMAISERPIDGMNPPLLMFMIQHLEQLCRRHKRVKVRGAEIIKNVKAGHQKIVADMESTLIGIDSEVIGLAQAMKWTQECMKGLIQTGEISVEDAFNLYALEDANLFMNHARKELGDYYKEHGHPLPEKSRDTDDEKSSEETTSEKPEDLTEEKNLSSLTVAELKALCKERELAVSGKKADLIERLS